MPTSKTRRGSCPRCMSRAIRHYLLGFPDFESLVDADGNLPAWIELTGCVIGPGPQFDRACEDCGLRWSSRPGARAVMSTWRELRNRIGVETNDEANDSLESQLGAPIVIAPFPALDDPNGKLELRHGAARTSLRFPFTYAEWESTLIDLVEESSPGLGDRLVPGSGLPQRP